MSRIFGGGAPPAPDAIAYEGFAITPDPQKADGQWRIAATIEKDGRTHRMIRADTMADREQCAEASVAKAKQMIDEQGDRLFG
nr:HlyU family transcriptional regulator [Jannaschia sp. Os4]